ncbi:unnamed protein product, partial [Musa hybrid cultivar]
LLYIVSSFLLCLYDSEIQRGGCTRDCRQIKSYICCHARRPEVKVWLSTDPSITTSLSQKHEHETGRNVEAIEENSAMHTQCQTK